MDDRTARELARQLSRNTEAMILTLQLRDAMKCQFCCSRVATLVIHCDYACDACRPHLVRFNGGVEVDLQELHQAPRARRLEQLLRNEG